MSLDNYGIDAIICPYCDYERKARFDDNEEGMEFEKVEFDCEACGEMFLVGCTIHVTYLYNSEKYEEDVDD